MKAVFLVRYGKADSAFEIRECPLPEPGRGQVRIAVEMFGLNFADVLARCGLYKELPPLPAVLGYDVVGRIDAVGEDVGSLGPGMRVVAMTRFGGYATHALSTCKGVAAIPESYDAAKATALGTQYATAWYASMEMVRLNEGDHVLIYSAAGGVGTALVQLAKLQRCVVFGTTTSASKVEYLRTIGVDHVLVGHGPGLESAYRAVSPSRPLDVVFDLLGGATVRQGLRLLGPGGRIVCCGVTDMMSRRPNIFHSLKTVFGFGLLHPVPLMLHSKGVIGVNMLRVADANQAMIRKCLTSVIARAVSGVLEPQVGGVFPVDRLAEAHAYLEQRRSTGKVAVHW